jgi:hypothetical protein
MFHSPVPVVYGNSPSVASVAAHGDSVTVEDESGTVEDVRLNYTVVRRGDGRYESRPVRGIDPRAGNQAVMDFLEPFWIR